MLVLSRRLNETIVLPGIDTTFELLAVRGGSVRIGVQAPESVAVLRGEVWEREKGGRHAKVQHSCKAASYAASAESE